MHPSSRKPLEVLPNENIRKYREDEKKMKNTNENINIKIENFRKMGDMYRISFILLLLVLWADLMILRINFFIALFAAILISIFVTNYFYEKKFYG